MREMRWMHAEDGRAEHFHSIAIRLSELVAGLGQDRVSEVMRDDRRRIDGSAVKVVSSTLIGSSPIMY
jgi:hypothetical protein